MSHSTSKSVDKSSSRKVSRMSFTTIPLLILLTLLVQKNHPNSIRLCEASQISSPHSTDFVAQATSSSPLVAASGTNNIVTTTTDAQSRLPKINSHVNKRETRKLQDHAPKLIHQPPSVLVKPNEPHTIECPIESQPTAQVRWFKDEQLLASQAPRLEQMGNELLFIQMLDDDTGDYYCEARNDLGSVTSDRFRLTVQSSVHEPKIRFEPRAAEVSADQQVEFTCTIPGAAAADDDNNGREQQQQRYTSSRGSARKRQQQRPEVSWKRNGRRLPVKWLDATNEAPALDSSGAKSRFVARSNGANEYILTITRALLKDDNSTFTCLYRARNEVVEEDEDDNSQASQDEELLRESSPVRLRVLNDNYVKLDVDLAPPIENLDTAGIPNEISRHNNNHTTQLLEPRRGVSSLRETLMDLYEIVKPALVAVGLVSLVAMFIILQFVIIRGRNRQNRYMKHQYSSAGSGGSSGAGSAGGSSSIDCDPVLNSLMARTLSAPSAGSLSGAGKKFRSYRDHMRKVAAAGDLVGSDLVDGYFRQQQQQQQQLPQFALPQHLVAQHEEPFFASAALGPNNLYNQSLAAREQARNLLQTSDHMRSLSSNLNNCHKSQHGQAQALRFGQNGSHLNLPLSFAFGANRQMPSGALDATSAAAAAAAAAASSSQLMANALWQPHLAAMMQQQQQPNHSNHKNHHDEHYQLVNCSSISPSSTSSAVGGGSGSNSSQQQRPTGVGGQRDSREFADSQQQQQPQNHYSIIENNDDEDRYEEVDQCRASSKPSMVTQTFQQRTSTFVMDQQQPVEESISKSSLRSSLKSDSSSSWQAQTEPATSGPMFDINRSKRKQQQDKSGTKLRNQHQDARTSYQDQLSPYAVSSICGSIPPPPPTPPQPPPVNSEAMKALTEQFDINQLMLLDESINNNNNNNGFNAPPPPPLPNSNS